MNENMEYTSIFVEASENLGIIYDSYKGLATDVEHFMDKIEDAVNDLNRKASEANIDLKSDINNFKTAVSKKMEPKPIDIRAVKSTRKLVRSFQEKLDACLHRLARIKDKVAYGGNYIRAIIKRPKVYGHNMDDAKFNATNSNIREVNRAIDWVEKALIDLFNLSDQDDNILTIVDKIYVSNHIFESTELPGGCYISEGDQWMLNTYDKKSGTAPGYIKGNHDMARWGEDESDDENRTLDDYRRSSSEDEDDVRPVKTKSSSSRPISDDDDEDDPPAKSSPNNASGPINYYYYTYHNSLNRNTGSFNKDRHDVHNISDDHSSNKIQSNTNSSSDEEDKEYRTIGTESAKPWELNIFPTMISESTMNEGFFDRFKKSGEKITRSGVSIPKKFTEACAALIRDFQAKCVAERAKYPLLTPIADEFDKVVHSFRLSNKPDVTLSINIDNKNASTYSLYGEIFTHDWYPEWPDESILRNKGIEPYGHCDTPDEGDDVEENLMSINIQAGKCLMNACKEITNDIASEPSKYAGLIISVNIDDIKNIDIAPSNAGIKEFIIENGMKDEVLQLIGKYNAPNDLQLESTITEDVGDADDDKPQGDHPVRDAMIDADRKLQTTYQNVKQTAQAGQQLYRAATRPVRRGKEWLNQQVAKWKDADETEIKEQLADPNARRNVFYAIKVAIDNGAYLKAGILLNPIILGLHFMKHKWFNHDKERIRNEMILELQKEMEIIDEKVKDADRNGDNKAKYQLMRFKTEIQKKLWRVTDGQGRVSKFL